MHAWEPPSRFPQNLPAAGAEGRTGDLGVGRNLDLGKASRNKRRRTLPPSSPLHGHQELAAPHPRAEGTELKQLQEEELTHSPAHGVPQSRCPSTPGTPSHLGEGTSENSAWPPVPRWPKLAVSIPIHIKQTAGSGKGVLWTVPSNTAGERGPLTRLTRGKQVKPSETCCSGKPPFRTGEVCTCEHNWTRC